MKRIAFVLFLTVPLFADVEQLVSEGPSDHAAYELGLGNCYENGGDPERAIATYRRGLKVDRNDTQLLYNLAVTLVKRAELEEARKLLKQELALQPWHPSDRARDAATRALALLGAGVEVKDAKNVTINVDTKPRKEEGEYEAVGFMLAIAGAAQMLPEEAAKSEFESLKLPGMQEWMKANDAEVDKYVAFMRAQK
jgi:tetratricopeptide (TPR) repeat protein